MRAGKWAVRLLYFHELKRMPGAFEGQVARLADGATAPRYVEGGHEFDARGLDRDGALRAVVARDHTPEATIGAWRCSGATTDMWPGRGRQG